MASMASIAFKRRTTIQNANQRLLFALSALLILCGSNGCASVPLAAFARAMVLAAGLNQSQVLSL
ncbi:hypothetical protein NHJ13734_005102 [Beauveria thailandica]